MPSIDQDRRLEQPVARCMSETFITLPASSTSCEAAKAMRDRHIGLLLLTDGDELVGVFSERDLVRSLADGDRPDEVHLADRARGDIITVNASASLQDGINAMAKRGIRHLVVVGDDDGQPVGVLSARDVLSEIAVV